VEGLLLAVLVSIYVEHPEVGDLFEEVARPWTPILRKIVPPILSGLAQELLLRRGAACLTTEKPPLAILLGALHGNYKLRGNCLV